MRSRGPSSSSPRRRRFLRRGRWPGPPDRDRRLNPPGPPPSTTGTAAGATPGTATGTTAGRRRDRRHPDRRGDTAPPRTAPRPAGTAPTGRGAALTRRRRGDAAGRGRRDRLPRRLRSGAGGGAGLSPIEGADGGAVGATAAAAGLRLSRARRSAARRGRDAAGRTHDDRPRGRRHRGGLAPRLDRRALDRRCRRRRRRGLDSPLGRGLRRLSGFACLLGLASPSPSGALGSSAIGSPRSPRLSARRRMRSADGSSMLDEWLFTPIFSSSERSSTTWFSTPSSRASS